MEVRKSEEEIVWASYYKGKKVNRPLKGKRVKEYKGK